MKNRLIISGIVTVVVLLGLLWFRHPKMRTLIQPSSLKMTNAVVASTASSTNSIAPSDSVPSSEHAPSNLVEKYKNHQLGKMGEGEMMQAILLAKNEQPQDFYGRVIDQYGKPIQAVAVTGEIVFFSLKSDSNMIYKTKTDEEGLFQFIGLKGWKFNAQVKKVGYEWGARGEGYQAPVGGKSSPSNRAILTMWKLRGPEPLNYSTIEAKIPYDGSPVTFNMATGRQTSNGDLRVALSQYPLEIKTGRERFDWAVKVEIPNGGLVEENDPYPYWAPADGYQPSFEFEVSSNSPDWLPNLRKNLYIKNAQGQYGTMQFDIYPGRSPTGLEVHFTINPSGSQNLEPKK